MSEQRKNVSQSNEDVTRREALVAAGIATAATLAGDAASAAEEKFNPNKLTFKQGIDRIKKAIAADPAFPSGKIVTSRDDGADKLLQALRVTNIPGGFTKYQLPVYFESGPGSQFFISIGAPNTEVEKHSHNEGSGLRFIVSGSIIYAGKELGAGDWMFIPKGQPYSMKVGPLGATIFYCYECSCA